MIRTIASIAVLAAAAASPAAAVEVKVSLAGKSAATVEREIKLAAEAVCRDNSRQTLYVYMDLNACIRETRKAALAAALPAHDRMASAAAPTARN